MQGIDEALSICEALAEDCSRITAKGPFADGYRAAGEDIVRAIRARRGGRAAAPSDDDTAMRDAAVEARTLARVAAAAEQVVARFGGDPHAASVLRALLKPFVADDALPAALAMADEPAARARPARTQSGARRVRGK